MTQKTKDDADTHKEARLQHIINSHAKEILRLKGELLRQRPVRVARGAFDTKQQELIAQRARNVELMRALEVEQVRTRRLETDLQQLEERMKTVRLHNNNLRLEKMRRDQAMEKE